MVNTLKNLDFIQHQLCLALLCFVVSFAAHSQNEYSYENTRNAYYATLKSQNLSPEEKSQALQKILIQLESAKQQSLKALTLYNLISLAIKQQEQALVLRWQTELEQINQSLQSPPLSFLIEKIEVERDYAARNYLKTIDKGLVLLEKSKNLSIKDKVYSDDVVVQITQIDIASLANILGVSYYVTGNYEAAQDYFLQAFKLYESLDQKTGMSPTLSNLSMISWAQDDFEKAMEYLQQAILISEGLENKRSYLANTMNQGIYYRELGKVDDAIKTLEKVLQHPDITKYPSTKIHTLLSLGNAYIAKNNLKKVKTLANEAVKLSEETNNEYYRYQGEVLLGELNILKREFREGIQRYERALNYYQEKKSKRKETDIYLALSEAFEKSGQIEKALTSFKTYHNMLQELQSAKRQETISKLQAKYDAETKNEKIELLKRENALKETELRSESLQKKSFLILGSLLSVIFILGLMQFYHRKETHRLKAHNLEIAAREKQLNMYSMAFKNTSDAVWICNDSFEIEAVNQAYCECTKKEPDEVIGSTLNFASVNGQDQNMANRLLDIVQNNGSWQGELFDQKSNGTIYPLDLKIETIKDQNGNIINYLGVFRDITEKRRFQEQLLKFATHDDLTGLPNRALLSELAERAVKNAQRNQEFPVLLFVNLDGFKKINDSFGHETGDAIIKFVAERLTNTLREKDIIARMGGDEFCVLATLKEPQIGAATIAKKVLRSFEQNFVIDSNSFKLTASIGIAISPDDANNAQELIRKSDIAMYDAKNAGKNGYSFFEKEMNNEVIARLEHEQKIIEAINQKYFIFYYQPLISIKDSRITGAEALIRWQPTSGRMIFPDEFIPFAEKSGLIEQIDQIVIDKVFEQTAIWEKNGINCGIISINLSAKIFSQSSKLLLLLQKSLEKHQVSANKFKIEITEGMLLQNIEQAIITMSELKTMGFLLAVDDFGTGFSSLNYLKRFPIDILKIDRSFISDMHQSKKDKRIVRSIIDLAHNLELSVVAEGVETLEHLQILAKYDCEEYQGYYFSKPVDTESIVELFKQHKIAS